MTEPTGHGDTADKVHANCTSNAAVPRFDGYQLLPPLGDTAIDSWDGALVPGNRQPTPRPKTQQLERPEFSCDR